MHDHSVACGIVETAGKEAIESGDLRSRSVRLCVGMLSAVAHETRYERATAQTLLANLVSVSQRNLDKVQSKPRAAEVASFSTHILSCRVCDIATNTRQREQKPIACYPPVHFDRLSQSMEHAPYEVAFEALISREKQGENLRQIIFQRYRDEVVFSIRHGGGI